MCIKTRHWRSISRGGQGYRYEIYCQSRALATPHCVVFVNTPLETAREWNEKREDKLPVQLSVFLSLPSISVLRLMNVY